MFTFYLFLLFWGIPIIFTFPGHKRSALANHPGHSLVNFHEAGHFDDYPYNTHPFYDNDDVWIWEVRNITKEDKPSEKPTKFKEEPSSSTATTSKFDYIPFKMLRDDSFEWRLFKKYFNMYNFLFIFTLVFVTNEQFHSASCQDSKETLNVVEIVDKVFHLKREHVQNVSYDKLYNRSVSHKLSSNDWIWSLFAYAPFNTPSHDPLQWKLLQTILHNKSDNIILSPVLAKLDLTLLYETTGIGSEAGQEWDTILPDLESFFANRDLYKQILESLKKDSMFYDVFAATKVYIDQRFQPRPNFLEILNNHFHANLEKLDFQNVGQSAKIINDWGDNITEGHLNYLVDAGELRNSALIVINVIYFDGQWTIPFPDKNTEERPFSVEESKQVKAQFMTQVQDFYYANSPEMKTQILRLPLKGFKYSMFLLLPHPKTTLDDVLREMDSGGLKSLQWQMNSTKVKVSIPKFQIDHTAHLKEFLQLLGVKTVFTTRASLIGLTGRNKQLPLSDIVQKTGLIVSEKGLTAYQATEAWNTDAINVRQGSTTDEFIANRPFAFFIEDETIGVLLLAGKITDPTLDTVIW